MKSKASEAETPRDTPSLSLGYRLPPGTDRGIGQHILPHGVPAIEYRPLEPFVPETPTKHSTSKKQASVSPKKNSYSPKKDVASPTKAALSRPMDDSFSPKESFSMQGNASSSQRK